jgi:prepilin peptidase CpaA
LEELFAAPLQGRIALCALGCALAVSVVTDLRRRRILNAVTFPAFAVVAASVIWLGGLPLLAHAALGAAICAGPLLAGVARGWMGAGDVKLMAVCGLVCGAMGGWRFSLANLLAVAVAGGVQALIWLAAARLRGAKAPKTVPYAVAIAAGTLWTLVAGGPLG